MLVMVQACTLGHQSRICTALSLTVQDVGLIGLKGLGCASHASASSV